jgi:hypothetical protein
LEGLLTQAGTGSPVDFGVGIIRADGQGQQIESVTLTAR